MNDLTKSLVSSTAPKMQLKEQNENISGKTFTVFYATLTETRNSGQLNEALKTSDNINSENLKKCGPS